ncbi:hypothetical protein EBR66_02010 [bacterium]|nr:hypothetical protein [bacterium]
MLRGDIEVLLSSQILSFDFRCTILSSALLKKVQQKPEDGGRNRPRKARTAVVLGDVTRDERIVYPTCALLLFTHKTRTETCLYNDKVFPIKFDLGKVVAHKANLL